MGFELNKGTLFIIDGDKTTKLEDGIPYMEEIELNAEEDSSHLYHLNNIQSCSFEVCDVDLANLNDLCGMPPSNGKFTMEYSIPIMIQARWHKKTRIRKKWLKRFGMKPDMVKMRANATAGEYHSDDGSFEFETDMPKYIWRPDQLRKDLKIEF